MKSNSRSTRVSADTMFSFAVFRILDTPHGWEGGS